MRATRYPSPRLAFAALGVVVACLFVGASPVAENPRTVAAADVVAGVDNNGSG